MVDCWLFVVFLCLFFSNNPVKSISSQGGDKEQHTLLTNTRCISWDANIGSTASFRSNVGVAPHRRSITTIPQQHRLDGNEKTRGSSRKLAHAHYHSGSIWLYIARRCGRAKCSVAGRPPWWTRAQREQEERDTNTEPEVPSDAGLWVCASSARIRGKKFTMGNVVNMCFNVNFK